RLCDRLFFAGERNDRNHWAELLAAHDLVILACAQDDGRQQEKPFVPPCGITFGSFGQYGQSFVLTSLNQARDEIELSLVVQWAHRGFRIEAVADDHFIE